MALLTAITPFIVLVLAVQSSPLVTPGRKLNYEDVARVKQLLRENDPRRLKAGQIKTFSVTDRDLKLVLDYALSHAEHGDKLSGRIDLLADTAIASVTLTLPSSPLGRYLNVSAVIAQASDTVAIGTMRVGSLPIPAWLVKQVARRVHAKLLDYSQYGGIAAGVEEIDRVDLNEGHVAVTYQWGPDIVARVRRQARDLVLSQDDKNRLRAYDGQLARISRMAPGRSVSLTAFLAPLFQLAAERSASGQNPVAENRALIVALAAYVMGRSMHSIPGAVEEPMHPGSRRKQLSLLGRGDLAKHFVVSAALAASAGSGLAHLIGVFKELDDSRDGSGFSFADLAADRAGVKLAEVSTRSASQARLLQQRMSNAVDEAQYMPSVDRLPEGIMAIVFRERYRDLDSHEYQMIEWEIESRIRACSAYW